MQLLTLAHGGQLISFFFINLFFWFVTTKQISRLTLLGAAIYALSTDIFPVIKLLIAQVIGQYVSPMYWIGSLSGNTLNVTGIIILIAVLLVTFLFLIIQYYLIPVLVVSYLLGSKLPKEKIVKSGIYTFITIALGGLVVRWGMLLYQGAIISPAA